MTPGPQSFTISAIGGLLNVLKSPCGISLAFDPASAGAQPQISQFDAIWDTGATNSCVSQAVISACGLAPVGMAQVHNAQTTTIEEAFSVNIYLPNGVGFSGVRVTRAKIPGADVLIGMDIINMGDFAVTNVGGVTKCSFRVPSGVHIDFVEEAKKAAQQKSTS